MADEILTSALPRSADVRSAVWELSLDDRAIFQLESYPQILVARGDRLGSNVVRVVRYGLDGQDLMTAAGSEMADVANTALGQTSVTVTIGRRSLSRDVSSLSQATEAHNVLENATFWRDIVIAAALTRTNAVAAQLDNFSTQVGASGVEMSLVTFLTALSTLEGSNVPGPYLCMLHSNQWRGIRTEHLLNVGGAAQFVPAPQGVGTGYRGRLFEVDTFISNYCVLATADRKGGMMGRSAILWAQLQPVIDGSDQYLIGDVLVERQRTAGTSVTEWHGHLFYGIAEFEDARGVEIISKN